MVLRRGLLLAPLLAVYSLGCRQTHLETGVSPESALGGLRRERVRLTVVDGRHLQLREPKITGDSVRGTSTRTGDYSGAVALKDIAVVSTERFDGYETLIAILFTAWGLGLLLTSFLVGGS